LERIFEPLFTTKDVGKGSGMGLAMVHGIMKQHGGWVEVSSQLNHGASFKLFLPVSPGAKVTSDTPAAAPIQSAIAGPAKERILVVEDEPARRTLVSAILQNAGYRVVVANDGIEA
jgi:two-component system, cell cycle sensor histidine kinase and response regulator CckA